MSDTDSFIEEVTEEVRRDRMFLLFKRYGWIAVLAILLLVGGAAYKEWRKGQATAAAQALGDHIMAALETEDPALRVEKLTAISAQDPAAQAIVSFITATEDARNGAPEAAVDLLQPLSENNDLPVVYRQIAAFKALLFQSGTTDIETRRAGFEALSGPGGALRLLAQEQLALLDIEDKRPDAALERLQQIISDAEVSAGLRRRAAQLIVALGGEVAAPAVAEDDASGQ